MSGTIYQITCKTTQLKYIGQATDLKYKNGKSYHYGPNGRWSDHVCASKTRNTPLCEAIRTYGRDDFTIEVLEEGKKEELDEREAHYITEHHTVYPNGYNVAAHSRNRHRDSSNLYVFYEDKVKTANISPIRNKGEFRLVYVYLTMKDETKERLTFGQTQGSTYEEAMEEVIRFLERLGCSYTTATYNSSVLLEKYASKIKEFDTTEITSVRITSASTLIAVYIGTSDMKYSKEHKRICFGGKKISKKDAYETAKEFVAELHVPENIIYDSYSQ